MRYIFIFIALITITISSKAQTVKAITQHGETVVLYDNGTWKYEKDITTEQSSTVEQAQPTKNITKGALVIDNTKEATSEKIELFNAVSKKLSRFFGEDKGRVRCNATASNNKGEVSLNLEFMMQVGDANRYFGFTAQDRTATIELTDGSKLTYTFNKNIEEKFIEKWSVSFYKVSFDIPEEDIQKLMNNKASRMTVSWKKIDEEYIFDNNSALQVVIADVI